MKQVFWKFPLTSKQAKLIAAEKERRIVAALVALQELIKSPELKQLVVGILLATSPEEDPTWQLMLGSDGRLDEIKMGDNGLQRTTVNPTRALMMKYKLEAE